MIILKYLIIKCMNDSINIYHKITKIIIIYHIILTLYLKHMNSYYIKLKTAEECKAFFINNLL
jgi:hypothetical protein